MAARAIWKGVIRFANISAPVKFFSALEDRKIHFRLLHEQDMTPVTQKMIHPLTGESVPYENIRRGYETDSGDIVMLEDDELQSLAPPASRMIDITRFVDPAMIDRNRYDRPYYLAPETNSSTYFALAKAMEKQKKEGIARWSMRKKRYLGALRSHNGHLLVITLRSAGQVVSASELPRPAGRPMDDQEIRMGEQLVRALEDSFDPAAYQDRYRSRVLELVEAKASGGTVKFEKAKKKRQKVISLSDLLKQSVQRAEKERKIA